MPQFNSDIEVRSQGVQDIMGHIPHWMVRWGICLIGVLIILFLWLSWLIHYPETESGEVIITTQSPPIKLISKSAGEIEQLYLKNGEEVNKGDVIAAISSLQTSEGIAYLNLFCEKVKESIKTGAIDTITYHSTTLPLGALQRSYSLLLGSIQEYQHVREEENTPFQVNTLNEQLKRQERLLEVTNEQKSHAQMALEIIAKRYGVSGVDERGVALAEVESLDKRQELLTSQNRITELKKEIVETSIHIAELRQQLSQQKMEFAQEGKTYLQKVRAALTEVELGVKSWQMNYQFVAPIDGKLNYMSELSPSQHIESGRHVFTVIPNNESYLALMYVPPQSLGKLAIGQNVRIRLHKFPVAQFGYLGGIVSEISPIASAKGYRVKVSIPSGLISSYDRVLSYSPEMTGVAQIITEDLRMIERIFNRHSLTLAN